MVRLEELYLISNGIGKIEGLPETESLKLLELGANRIIVIEGLEGTPNIEQLFFGQNRLTSMIVPNLYRRSIFLTNKTYTLCRD